MSLILGESTITSLRDGTFELRSLAMQLRRGTSDEADTIAGPGAITRDAAGRFRLTMYTPGPHDYGVGAPRWPVGRVLPEEAYYTLTATDEHGRCWASPFVLPDASWSAGGRVTTATLRELVTEEDHTARWPDPLAHNEDLRSRRYIELYLFRELHFPETTVTTSVVTSGTRRRESVDRNVAEFDACGCDFTLTREEGFVRVHIVPRTDVVPPELHLHAIDALEFVLAEPILPAILVEYDRGFERVTLRPGAPQRWNPILPKVIPRKVMGSEADTWQLFRAYLQYITADGQPAPHPLTTQWRIALRGSASSLEVMAIVFSVAVEAILRLVQPRPEGASSHQQRQLRFWTRRVRTFLRKFGCPRPVADRIDRSLQRVTQPRAVDLLRRFAERGQVEQQYVNAWHALRNPTAHGARRSDIDGTELLYACNAVAVLLYQLVFSAVGYCGRYSRFDERGWHVASYPPMAEPTTEP